MTSLIDTLESITNQKNIQRDLTEHQKKSLQTVIDSDQIPPWINPQTIPETQKIISAANNHKAKILLTGMGTKLGWGNMIKKIDLVIGTLGLNQLIDYPVKDLTITIESGMRFQQLQAILAQNNQFIPLDPLHYDQATIGGIIATGDTGSLRTGYGGVRDLLIGISFIRSDGHLTKAGGRVVKNVAGYDLMKLLTGSHGTLGLITQVTLRVYPIPEHSATIVLTGPIDQIEKLLFIILRSSLTPTAFDLLSPGFINHLGFGNQIAILLRFQTIPEGVKEQSQQIWKIATTDLGLTGTILSNNSEQDLWTQISQLKKANNSITAKFGIKKSSVITTLTQFPSDALTIIHSSKGLGVTQLDNNTTIEQLLKYRHWCESQSGYFTILTAEKSIKQNIDLWGYNGNALKLMQGIKQQFDPYNLFNPNRFVSNI